MQMTTSRTDATEAAVRAALDRLCPDGPVGVAVSGGGDSTALLAMAAAIGRDLHAATVDHGLRPESPREAEAVAALCACIGVHHTILTAEGLADGGNLPARARDARYDLLAGWAEREGLPAVLLAHTLDDQAETVLMRLARGSGVDGLSGMATGRRWRGICWLRPMLGVRREALRDWLRARDIGWTEDPTNEDLAYDRIKARRALVALGPLCITAEGLAATAGRLQRQRAVLEAAAADLAATAVRTGELGEVFLDRVKLAAALPETGMRVLAGMLRHLSGSRYRPRFRALDPLFHAVLAPDFRGATLSGCIVHGEGDRIEITREPAAIAPVPLRSGSQLWDGRWTITAPEPVPAALIAPLGRALPEAARFLRELGVTPPAAWSAASPKARAAVPGVFRDDRGAPGALLAAPSAGLFADASSAEIGVTPPAAAGSLRQDAED